MARKSYVQVKTPEGYKLVEKSEAYKFRSNKSATIMPDMKEMISPIDGEVITSRSAYRNHMKKHGVIDVGNEKLTRKKRTYDPGDSIKKELYHCWSNVSQEH